MKIKQNLTTVNYNKGNNKNNKYIVIHYTGNKTDTAYNNTNYFKSVNRNASANYFVDDNSIYQCVEDKNIAWHCGGKKHFLTKGGSYYGKCTNTNSIGIEMCCTNGDVSAKTEANTIELVKYLMNKYNISSSNVIRHYDVTGKNCPAPFVKSNSRWINFKNKLTSDSNASNTTKTSKIEAIYRVYDNVKKIWLPQVKNLQDYAGIFGHSAGGFQVYTNGGGSTKIIAHVKGGSWLPEVKDGSFKSGSNDYAGIKGKPIDGIAIYSQYGKIKYRVHIKGGKWLPYVTGYNKNDSNNGYAGILGKEIDAIQVYFE